MSDVDDDLPYMIIPTLGKHHLGICGIYSLKIMTSSREKVYEILSTRFMVIKILSTIANSILHPITKFWRDISKYLKLVSFSVFSSLSYCLHLLWDLN